MGENIKTDHPGLYEKIVPDYEPGCKRVLITNDWIPTMMRPNVHIITDRVTGLSNEGIITTKDTTKPDVLIYATGFEAGDLLAPLTHKIRGKNGITLKEKWNGTP